MENFTTLVGLFLGGALGQFTVPLGWIAIVAAVLCGYFRTGWFGPQLIGALGGLVAAFVFKGTAVDLKLGGLAGKITFNVILYLLIGSVGYALGWLVMRVLRKDADTA